MTDVDLGLPISRKRSSLRSRWAVLVLVSVTVSGVYYSFDIPAALHQQLMGYMPPSDKFEVRFNLLYSLYSLPNVILPLFGGYIVDRIGAPICLIAFAALGFLGQLLFAIGTSAKSWAIMLLGRFVYGFGGESICVAQSALLSEWFEGREMAFSFGVALSVSLLGSVFNNMLSPAIANSSSTPLALWVGVIINCVTVFLAIAIAYIDKKAAAKCREDNQTTALLTEALLVGPENHGDVGSPLQIDTSRLHSIQDDEEPSSTPHLSDVKKFGSMFWLLSLSCLVVYGCVLPFNNIASGVLLERNYFKSPPKDCQLVYQDQCTSGTLVNGTNPSYDSNGDVCPVDKYVSPVLPTSINITQTDSSWKMSEYVHDPLTAAHIDCGDPFWGDACTKDYCDAQNRATEKAGRIMSIPYFISAGLSPVLGHVVDKVGWRAIIASVAPLMLTFVHVAMAISRASPVLPLIGQGIAYSLFASVLWPSVPLVVEKMLTGTAFGVITAIQNIGSVLFPLIIAAIYNHDGNQYIPNVEYLFIACASFGVAVGIALNVMDWKTGNRLNNASGEATVDNSRQDVGIVTSDDGASYIS